MKQIFTNIINFCEEWTDEKYLGELIPEDEEGQQAYELAIDLIQVNILGFCACGNPDDNVQFVYNTLAHVLKLKERVWDDTNEYDYDEWTKEGLELFGNSQVEYFMYYWLDKEDFTEHGGSVPGWLDEKGYQLMEIIELIDFENEEIQ